MYEHKLPPDVKKTWVEALRSGNYQQVIGVLKSSLEENPDEYGYCCLGVLHQTLGGTWVQSVPDNPEYGFALPLDGEGEVDIECGSLILEDDYGSPVVTKEIRAALMQHHESAFSGTVQGHLMLLNDEGYNFTAIADWIEENL